MKGWKKGMEKLCGNCSTPFRHGDRFCRKCGAELPKTQQSNPERKGLINLALESYIIDSDTLRNHRDRERIGYINLVYGLAVIKAYAFSECKNLKSISIPASVERIESHAFCQCSSLKTVYYKGTKEQREAIEIGSNDELTNAKWIYEPQPPDVRPEDGDRCPRCDGYISNGVCDRCGLDTRRASGSIAAPSPKPVKEDSSVRKSNAADAVRRTQSTESNPAQNKKQASAELKTESDKSRKSSYIIVLLLLVVFGIFSVVTTLLSLAEEIDSDYAWIFILLGLISFGGMIYWLSAAPKKPNVWIGLPAIVFTACGGFPGIIFAVWGYAQARKAGNNRRNPSTLWRLCMCSFALLPAVLLVWPGLIIGIIEGSL